MKHKLIFFILAFATFSTSACLFHGSIGAPNAPKGASWTLVTTQLQVNKGLLAPIPQLDGNSGFRRAMWWLTLLSRQMDTLDVEQTYVYLSDVGLWSYYDKHSVQRLQLEVMPEGHSSYPYIVLTQTTLSNLLSGEISIGDALSNELILLSDDLSPITN
ncbi:hypothetical protein ACPV5O_15640 [Vibrio maritimus]|uniref:hypothetical protein n=1 Tax=Vibrio maritimus TaxID=990268 RepID=UPI004068CDE1